MTLRRIAMPLLALALIAGCVSGCTTKGPEILSLWPRVDSERVVPKPAEPPRWPLTGMDAQDETSTHVRVVSVKIENSPEARPQVNLQLADIVYESVTEGGITRFNAIFHSNSPAKVGPVRSARLSDLHIVPQYGALFVFSGASSSVNSRINKTSIDNLSEDAGITYPFFRGDDRPRPHNLYVVLEKVREEAARRKMPTTQDVKGLAFDRKHSEEPSNTITEVGIPFSPANRVVWTYDAASNAYLRVNNGSKHNDSGTGKQVSARNVVVLWAKHAVASHDKVGSTTYEITLKGSGKCSVFRDGQRFDGTWTAGVDSPPTFKAGDGSQIKLTPGNTWMQVVQPSVNITMK
ncbi:MAG: DUF3048 domain-containing protein [Coriobacteriia bacterium]